MRANSPDFIDQKSGLFFYLLSSNRFNRSIDYVILRDDSVTYMRYSFISPSLIQPDLRRT